MLMHFEMFICALHSTMDHLIDTHSTLLDSALQCITIITIHFEMFVCALHSTMNHLIDTHSSLLDSALQCITIITIHVFKTCMLHIWIKILLYNPFVKFVVNQRMVWGLGGSIVELYGEVSDSILTKRK
ncbi:hypothetical protein AMTRI_Chr07g78080 [Amborella trichopoda]